LDILFSPSIKYEALLKKTLRTGSAKIARMYGIHILTSRVQTLSDEGRLKAFLEETISADCSYCTKSGQAQSVSTQTPAVDGRKIRQLNTDGYPGCAVD
jgi:hypothetical protein